MKLPRINGRTARAWVLEKQPFKNSNGQFFAYWQGLDGLENRNARYVVYSYGTHWPLFVYVPQVNLWFENKEKFSRTTSKHRMQAHPLCETVPLSLEQIKLLDRLGHSSLVYDRLTKGNTNG